MFILIQKSKAESCSNKIFKMFCILRKNSMHAFLQHKVAGQMVRSITRGMACKGPQKMEDYFKDKKIIVTGSCAGLLHN